MATDAIIVLNRLSCIRESDGTGHSEPYIWPVLIRIDDDTLATPELVAVSAPALGNARVVIKSDMRAGETADIPGSVAVRRTRWRDGLRTRRLILAVALWEDDETPEDAMRAGFQAFSRELRAAVADNLPALNQANNEQEKEIIAIIEARVRDSVASAIENGLTISEKARVLLGTLNLDDPIGSAFRQFREFVPTPIALPFALTFGNSSSDEYEIQGEFVVRVVTCQAESDRVTAAQTAVDDIEFRITSLQEELQHASPSEKPRIIRAIRRQQERLPAAIAALEDARRALRVCTGTTVS
jgi:hypothetical protein